MSKGPDPCYQKIEMKQKKLKRFHTRAIFSAYDKGTKTSATLADADIPAQMRQAVGDSEALAEVQERREGPCRMGCLSRCPL